MRRVAMSLPEGEAGTSSQPAPQPRSDWATLRRLLPYLWHYRLRVAVALGFLVAAKMANVGVPVLLKNGSPEAPPTMSFLAATPKPRLVRLEVASAGEEPFVVAGSTRKAIHYVLEVEIGGLAGKLAGLLGKQPPDHHVWIQAGEAPGFLKSEGPLYAEGPTWRIELTSPSWRGDGS